MNKDDHILTPEEMAKMDKKLDQVYNLSLKQREWIVLFNIVASVKYGIADALLVKPILDKLQSIAAVDTNIKDTKKKEVIIN